MTSIHKIAIFGASGNFGTPITAALVASGFQITVISRLESQATFPAGYPVIKTEYTVEKLAEALEGHDVVVCAIGPPGYAAHNTILDAAVDAGVKRFIIDEFGWGSDMRGLPEFDDIHRTKKSAWDHAAACADANSGFTWTGITIGNPIDWALKRFPAMGFDIDKHEAIIYDDGTEEFTGTTLEGIAQSVVGILQHPDETANRFVKVRSIQTCQRDLLAAFEKTTSSEWNVQLDTVKAIIERGRMKKQDGNKAWVLDLVVGQLYESGVGRSIVVSREESDNVLLGLDEKTAVEIVKMVYDL